MTPYVSLMFRKRAVSPYGVCDRCKVPFTKLGRARAHAWSPPNRPTEVAYLHSECCWCSELEDE